MGLSQPKKKVKLSHDPNNTNWTKNTSSFGHKILTSHGWTPGDYLGATNAAHAESYTVANASHIRVVLKDDNLGLGAKKGSGQGPGECTGLDAFQSLLGRLNADDEDEYVQEERKRADLKKAIYTEQKWGTMRFVKGGLLVGDKVVELAEAETERVRNLETGVNSGPVEVSKEDHTPSSGEEVAKRGMKEKKSKKHADDVEIESKKKSRKDKKRKNQDNTELHTPEETDAEKKLRKKEKKAGKRKAEEEVFISSPKNLKSESHSPEDSDVERALRKKERKERKEKQRKAEEETSSLSSIKRNDDSVLNESSSPKDTTASIPEGLTNNTPRPTILGGRHAVRARNIAQKRMASMDTAALNQIFMVKG